MSRIIYIDSDFKCYTANDGARTAIETGHFDGICDAIIECYRLIPAGMSWKREDGAVFHGEMVAPWKDFKDLEAAQQQYERTLAEMDAAYREGVNSV